MLPAGETDSQAPPFAVAELTVKLKFEPALAIVMICGKGFAPARGMVKLSGFTWLKTWFPTNTTTGTETLPVAVAIRI